MVLYHDWKKIQRDLNAGNGRPQVNRRLQTVTSQNDINGMKTANISLNYLGIYTHILTGKVSTFIVRRSSDIKIR